MIDRHPRKLPCLAAVLAAACLTVALLVTGVTKAQAASFSDVSTGAWYSEYVSYVSNRGLMTGYSDGSGRFDPEGGVSRAMVATVLYRFATGNAGNGGQTTRFADVERGLWYTEPIEWCRANGVVTGYAGGQFFGPNDPVTREQLATMLYRFAGVYGKASAAGSPRFPDAAAISGYALEGVAWCNQAGILTGHGVTGMCNPLDGATRGQLAKMLTVLARNVFGGGTPVKVQDISDSSLSLTQTFYTYDGTAVKPGVTVRLGETTLKNGTDYTVEYSNNVHAGTARVTVTGKGDYKGTAQTTFQITAASLSSAAIALSPSSYTYDGTAKKPGGTVKLGAKVLVYGVDYTASYTNNVDAGTATATITGKGNYSGTASKTFSIARSDISRASVLFSPASYTYDGKPKEPKATVTLDGRTLVANTDYTVEYADNVASGTASATIRGKGNHTGSKTASFQIVAPTPSSIEAASIKVDQAALIYDGKAKEPSLSVSINGKALVKGTDYTVAFVNNVNAGTATAIVTGKGQYTGSASTTFTIEPCPITRAAAVVSDSKPSYTGLPIEPELTLCSVYAGSTKLAEGAHYTVYYEDNVLASTEARVMVRGTGNYTGALTAAKFTIYPMSLASAKITLDQDVFEFDGTEKRPAVIVTLNGRVLDASDYTVTYANNVDAGTATVTVTGTTTVTIKNKVPTIKGTGGYYSYASTTFLIEDSSTAHALLYDDGALVIQKGSAADSSKGQPVAVFKGFDDVETGMLGVPWRDYRDAITSVAFVGGVAPVSMEYWFSGCSNLASVDFSGLDGNRLTSLNDTFAGCVSLASIDFSGVDTSHVECWDYLFGDYLYGGCTNLASVNLAGCSAQAATSLCGMFMGCASLTDLAIFDVCGTAGDLTGIFDGCASLTSLDLSGWDVSNVLFFDALFRGCSNLQSLDIRGWDTASSLTFVETFAGCSSLTSLDLTGWSTGAEHVREYYGGHSAPITSWEEAMIVFMDDMFWGCDSLATVTVGEKLVWGAGECPLPDRGDSGCWVDANSRAYAHDDIPSGLATTYTWMAGVVPSYPDEAEMVSLDDAEVADANEPAVETPLSVEEIAEEELAEAAPVPEPAEPVTVEAADPTSLPEPAVDSEEPEITEIEAA